MKCVVCVEGNIGAGKSELLKALASKYTTVPEPLGEWDSLLTKFYTDPGKYGLAMNLRVLASKAKAWRDLTQLEKTVFFERSPGTMRYVFAGVAHNDGKLSHDAYDLIKKFDDALGFQPDGIVWLDCPSMECTRRIEQRGRSCEAGITEEYLRKLEFQYTTYIKYAECPVLKVSALQPVHQQCQQIEAWVEQLTKKIN